jgi:hypothetical protein
VIDVGGQHLTLGTLRRGRTYKSGAARQQRPHIPRIVTFGVDGDPVTRTHDLHRVAGHNELGIGTDDACRSDDIALTTVDTYDTTGQQTLLRVRGELGLPFPIPAVQGERMRSRKLKGRERQGVTLHKGGPGTALAGAGEERGQPEATEVDLMNFRMRAAPISTTAIGHTSRTSQITRDNPRSPLERFRL